MAWIGFEKIYKRNKPFPLVRKFDFAKGVYGEKWVKHPIKMTDDTARVVLALYEVPDSYVLSDKQLANLYFPVPEHAKYEAWCAIHSTSQQYYLHQHPEYNSFIEEDLKKLYGPKD